MPIVKMKFFTREIVQARPDDIFVFGDNMYRAGFGGQAGACRGEPNTLGIPTKFYPGMENHDFFSDNDFVEAKFFCDREFDKLIHYLSLGKTVILPADGLGTGLAELPTRAPKIYEYICKRLKELELI